MFKVGDIVKIRDEQKPILPDRCNHNRHMKIIHIEDNRLYFDDTGMEINHLGEQNGIHFGHVEYDISYLRKMKINKINNL